MGLLGSFDQNGTCGRLKHHRPDPTSSHCHKGSTQLNDTCRHIGLVHKHTATLEVTANNGLTGITRPKRGSLVQVVTGPPIIGIAGLFVAETIAACTDEQPTRQAVGTLCSPGYIRQKHNVSMLGMDEVDVGKNDSTPKFPLPPTKPLSLMPRSKWM